MYHQIPAAIEASSPHSSNELLLSLVHQSVLSYGLGDPNMATYDTCLEPSSSAYSPVSSSSESASASSETSPAEEHHTDTGNLIIELMPSEKHKSAHITLVDEIQEKEMQWGRSARK